MSEKKVHPPGTIVQQTVDTESYGAWLGNDKLELSGILSPLHIDELQEMIQWGSQEKQRFVVQGQKSQSVPPAKTPDRPVWALDLSRMDVPFEAFLQSQSYWLPATMPLSEIELILGENSHSMGIWSEIFPDCSLGGAVACGSPMVRQAFYQKGPFAMGLEGVLPSGRRFQTCEAPRVAVGFRADLLWYGTYGQVGPISRVLLSVSASSNEHQRYLIRTETMEEATGLALELLKAEFTPELSFCSRDSKGPYLFWSQKVTNTRDYIFADTVLQMAEHGIVEGGEATAIERFQEIYHAPAGCRFVHGVRWNELDSIYSVLEGRKKGWILRIAGRHGLSLELIRPWPKKIAAEGPAQADLIKDLIDAVDAEGLFHEVQT